MHHHIVTILAVAIDYSIIISVFYILHINRPPVALNPGFIRMQVNKIKENLQIKIRESC